VPHLFSYGTLQLRDVQLANFGRELSGRPDSLPGYRRELVEITDPAIVQVSGSSQHPIVLPSDDPSDFVDGAVFEITDAELAAADEYEVDDYARVAVTLRSGAEAWVYVAKSQENRAL